MDKNFEQGTLSVKIKNHEKLFYNIILELKSKDISNDLRKALLVFLSSSKSKIQESLKRNSVNQNTSRSKKYFPRS